MNEKEAIKILKEYEDSSGPATMERIAGYADGYLEAIEKTQSLVEDLKDYLTLEDPTAKDYHKILKSLNKWEKEK